MGIPNLLPVRMTDSLVSSIDGELGLVSEVGAVVWD